MEAVSEDVRRELPHTGQLLAAAHTHLAEELALLPEWGSEALWRALQQGDGTIGAVSPGALVHVLRQAVFRRDDAASRQLFLLLLQRVAAANAIWARRTAQRAWGSSAELRRTIAEDLQQEITLHLWEQLTVRAAETWELFFRRSLEYAQRHVATAYMVRNGYWHDRQTARPTRGLALLLSQLALNSPDDTPSIADSAQQAQLHIAELADMRLLVASLPAKERIAVILRFWWQADEQEIAEALGGVTTRTVRNILRRAYTLLRARYAGVGGWE